MNVIKVCPKDSKECDRSCGFGVHFNVTRATKPVEPPIVKNICPKAWEDCDHNCGFDVHQSKDSTNNNDNICLSCEG